MTALIGGDLELYVGVGSVIVRHGVRQPVEGIVYGNPRVQGSADDALQGIQISAHLFHFPRRRTAVGQNRLPGGGKPNPLMGPQQQLHPQLPFNGADSLGQGRLGDVQLVRRFCNVSAVR